MQLINERKESVYRYDLNCDDNEEKTLREFALKRFATDIPAQIEYAVVKMLEDYIANSKDVTKSQNKAPQKKTIKKQTKQRK